MAGHDADLGKQQTQVVNDFRGGSDRRPIRRRRMLVRHRDRGRNAPNALRGRFLQPFQELPCVGGEAFDISALTLRIERVEGQACLTTAADSAEDNQFFVRNVETDILQVVDMDTAQFNLSGSQIADPSRNPGRSHEPLPRGGRPSKDRTTSSTGHESRIITSGGRQFLLARRQGPADRCPPRVVSQTR